MRATEIAHLPVRIRNKITLIDDCWLWTGHRNKNTGYGIVSWRLKASYAHRVVYELLVGGPIPDDLELDHLCRVHACVNPAHLEPVTHRINMLRGANPRMVAHRNGTCQEGHPASEFYRRADGRVVYCKACRRERRR
jgi:hypothetical protein